MQRKISNIKYKLHSIPTLLLRDRSSNRQMKNKPNVLYSIPCVCVLALLFMGVISLFPSSSEEALAWVVGGGPCTESYANFSIDNSDVIQQVAPGEVGYISKSLSISYCYTSEYNMYITAPTELKSSDGSTTLSGVGSEMAPEDMPNNSWGYAYSYGNSSADATTLKYNSFTGTAQSIASSTPSSSDGSITLPGTLAIAAKFDDEAASGHYTATINLSMVSTPMAVSSYTITYDANGGTGSPANQTCTVQGASGTNCTTTLSSTKPTRTNYTFLGWSASSTATSASYSAGGTISISSNTTLYAVWEANSAVWSNGTNSGITYMQDITTGTSTSSFCSSSLPTHASITLKDNRDESSYTIVKMADGKCWMTQNLKIVNKTITSADSDVSSSFTIPASSISGFNNESASNAYVSDSTGYYTWCAATAGTCSSTTSNGTNAASSICPKGWKLPTGGTSGNTDFYNLFKNMGLSISGSLAAGSGGTKWGTGDLAKVQGAPYNFAYTGFAYNSSLLNTTADGRWWSRTAYSNTEAYNLYIDGSYIHPATGNNRRRDGLAVRCVAQ